MKGVPEETLNAIIPITVKPILMNKGQLTFKLVPPEKKLAPCTIFIDDKMTPFADTSKVFLDTGIHDI